MWIGVCVYIYIYISTDLYLLSLSLYIYIYMDAYIYIYTHTYICIYIPSQTEAHSFAQMADRLSSFERENSDPPRSEPLLLCNTYVYVIHVYVTLLLL